MLRKSIINNKWDHSDESIGSAHGYSSAAFSSDIIKSGASDSDHSELLVASEQALNPIETEKLTKVYNEQGHYAISQAYDSLFFFHVGSPMMRNIVNTLLHIGATIIIILNFAILFYWLQYASPKTTMKGFYELNSPVPA